MKPQARIVSRVNEHLLHPQTILKYPVNTLGRYPGASRRRFRKDTTSAHAKTESGDY